MVELRVDVINIGGTLRIAFQGVPLPQMRPRIIRANKSSKRMMDPQRRTKQGLRYILNSKIAVPFSGAVGADLSFVFPAPQSWGRKKTALAYEQSLWKKTKPDIDNLIKFYLDVMKGPVYEDDNAVSYCNARKVYGCSPCTIVEVRPLESDPVEE